MRCECSKFLPSDTLVRVELSMVNLLCHHFAKHTVNTENIDQNAPTAAISRAHQVGQVNAKIQNINTNALLHALYC